MIHIVCKKCPLYLVVNLSKLCAVEIFLLCQAVRYNNAVSLCQQLERNINVFLLNKLQYCDLLRYGAV
jgi:hypothetical protein